MRQIFLVRHAHRETDDGRMKDNGLSEKGKDQAKAVAKFVLEASKGEDFLLLSSPKKRCIETLEPLGKKLGRDVNVEINLDEGGNLEKKVQDFFNDWKKTESECTVICSHGDWLPVAIEQILRVFVDFKKGAVCELRYEDKKFTLHQVVQDP